MADPKASAPKLAAGIRATQQGHGAAVPPTPPSVYQGQQVQFTVSNWDPSWSPAWTITADPTTTPIPNTYHNVVPTATAGQFTWDTTGIEPATYAVSAQVKPGAAMAIVELGVTPPSVTVKVQPVGSGDTIPVTMKLSGVETDAGRDRRWLLPVAILVIFAILAFAVERRHVAKSASKAQPVPTAQAPEPQAAPAAPSELTPQEKPPEPTLAEPK